MYRGCLKGPWLRALEMQPILDPEAAAHQSGLCLKHRGCPLSKTQTRVVAKAIKWCKLGTQTGGRVHRNWAEKDSSSLFPHPPWDVPVLLGGGE